MSKPTTRNFFPSTELKQLEWARNFVNEIQPIANRLGVTNVPDLQLAMSFADRALEWQANAQDLARERTKDKHAILWNKVAQKYDVLYFKSSINPGREPQETFGAGGLFPLIFAAIDKFVNNPAICTPDVKELLRLNPLAGHAEALENIICDLRGEFTGGEVLLRMSKPAPTELISLYVNRYDGTGEQHFATVTTAKFTDHHELPAERTTWDYSARLLNKEGIPFGRTAYLSITVKAGGL